MLQQEKMAKCNKEAGDKSLKGDERKKFMSECLKAKSDAAKPEVNEQQSKMGACNKDATQKNLKGDERKKFMSDCLKGDTKGGDAKAGDAHAKCEASAAEKKLAGAAKASHMKKCMEDAKGEKKDKK
jgi:hypothetical protein